MAAQEVIDRVNEEELRGTTAIVGEDTSDCWIKYLKAKGMKTVSRLLNHEGGVMKTTGTDEVKAAKKWATFMKTDGDEKKQRDEAEEADDVGRCHAPGEWEDMEGMVGGGRMEGPRPSSPCAHDCGRRPASVSCVPPTSTWPPRVVTAGDGAQSRGDSH